MPTPLQDQERATLRRPDLVALLAFLNDPPRPARLRWAGQSIAGTIQALGDCRLMQFRADPEACEVFPRVGEAADVHFRIRGVNFRCDAVAHRADPRDGALGLEPGVVEWSLTSFRYGGIYYSAQPTGARLQAADGRIHYLRVLALDGEELHLFGWPPPRELVPGSTWSAHVVLGRTRLKDLKVEIAAIQSLFPGCQGRALRGVVCAGKEQVGTALARLTQSPDKRSQPL